MHDIDKTQARTAAIQGDSPDPESESAVSRRSFIELSVGAIAALPMVAGGFALTLAPDQAHGAETSGATTKIIIAKANEAGLAVVDLTGKKRAPVADANVVVKSNETGKQVTGKTNKDGTLLIDLTTLTKPTKDRNGQDSYAAEVSVSVEAKGYRAFQTGWMTLRGGRGYDLPTRKVGKELAYPSLATLSDWDILYTNNEFAITQANDATHKIVIAFVAAKEGAITVSLANATKKTVLKKTTCKATYNKATKRYEARAEFKGAFLMRNHADALPVGAQFSVRYTVDNKRYEVPLRLKTAKAPTVASAPMSKNQSFAPFGDDDMNLSFRAPSWVPLIAGEQIRLWKPDLPIDVCFDPYGYFRASVRTPEWGYKSKNGKVDGDTWKKLPRESFAQQFDKQIDDMKNAVANSKLSDTKNSTFYTVPKSTSFKLAFSAEAVVAGRWNEKSSAYRCKGEMRGILSMAFSYAQQIFAGPFPIVLQFDLNMRASIGVGCGIVIPAKVKKGTEFSAWEFDYTTTGINFTIFIAPALSVGVGIKGIASVSLQGSLAFTVFVSAGPLPEGSTAKNPHAIVGLKVKLRVVIQLFLFTVPIDLWTYDKPKLYDSWSPDDLKAQSEETLRAQAVEAAFSWFENNQPIAAILGDELAEFASEGVETAEQALGAMSADDGIEPLTAEITNCVTDNGMKYRTMLLGAGNAKSPGKPFVAGSPNGSGNTLAAASSPALSAQDETLQAQGDGFKPIDYAPLANGHDYKLEAISDAKEYLKIGNDVGMVPGARQCIVKNVMSDPRVKVVAVGGYPVMFRIAAVKVKGKIRTRVVGQRLQTADKGAGPLCVFDFDPQIKAGTGKDGKVAYVDRNDLWDYDFDVQVLHLHPSYESVHLFVISGNRAAGASFGQIATDQVFQHARFDIDSQWLRWDDMVKCWAHGFKASDYFPDSKYKYHNFSCPSIQHPIDDPSRDNSNLLFVFLDRAATSPDRILSDDTDDVRIRVGMCGSPYVISSADTLFQLFDLSQLTKDHQDATIYELTCGKRLHNDKTAGWNIITLRGGEKAYHYQLLTSLYGPSEQPISVKQAKFWTEGSATGFLDDKDDKDMLKLIDWPAHDNMFLAAVDGKLQSVKVRGVGKDGLEVEYANVGPDNFSISSFDIDSSGTILYYPTVREGSPGYDYALSEDGEDVTHKDKPKINEHRIMACRLRNGKFSDPFAFATVDYDMDDLSLVNVSPGSVGFLSTDVIDANKGLANLYYTSMPFVKCANVIACDTVSSFAFPETEALFDLTVRNDGNTYISGFTARLSEKGGKEVSSKELTFSADTLQESVYNPKANGTFQNVEDDFALAPGKIAVYRVALMIPKGWSGTKRVNVKATDVVIVPVKGQGLSGQADDPDSFAFDDSNAYEYVVGSNNDDYDIDEDDYYDILSILGENKFFDEDDYDDVHQDPDEDDYELELDDANISDGEDPDQEDDSHGKKGGKKSRKTAEKTVDKTAQRSTVPVTGDPLGGMNGLLAGAVVAGAAMAAYSRRRLANERAADQALPDDAENDD